MAITGWLDTQKVNDKNCAFNGKVASKRMEDINSGIGDNLRNRTAHLWKRMPHQKGTADMEQRVVVS